MPSRKSTLKSVKSKSQDSEIVKGLPCRENQFFELKGIIEGKLKSLTGGCLYLAGVPGTGKTATVQAVRKAIEKNRRKEESEFKFVYLNCLKLTDPHQVYFELYKELEGNVKKQIHHRKSKEKLDELFKRQDGPYYIAIIDELDALKTKNQEIIYHLFDWPNQQDNRLLVVAIANTMNLPETLLDKRVISRAGFHRIDFPAYQWQELIKIIKYRIDECELFHPDAINLIARKVTNIAGDARKALDLTQRVIELIERKKVSKDSVNPLITNHDVQNVTKLICSSPLLVFLKKADKFQLAFMEAIQTDFRVTGKSECTLGDAFTRFLETHLDFFPNCPTQPTFGHFFRVAYSLHNCGLIVIEPHQVDIERRVRLRINMDDLDLALREIKEVS